MFPSPSLPRGGYLEAGGGSGGHPVDRYVSVAGQRHGEGGRRLLKRLLVRSRAGVCRAAALDHPRRWCQPGQADQRPASPAPHWRGGEDPLCHGGQPTGGLARTHGQESVLFRAWNSFDLFWLQVFSISSSVKISGTRCSTHCSLRFFGGVFSPHWYLICEESCLVSGASPCGLAAFLTLKQQFSLGEWLDGWSAQFWKTACRDEWVSEGGSGDTLDQSFEAWVNLQKGTVMSSV